MHFSKSINLILIGELFALVATTGAMAAEAIIGGRVYQSSTGGVLRIGGE
jgi:hypothetical protein